MYDYISMVSVHLCAHFNFSTDFHETWPKRHATVATSTLFLPTADNSMEDAWNFEVVMTQFGVLKLHVLTVLRDT